MIYNYIDIYNVITITVTLALTNWITITTMMLNNTVNNLIENLYINIKNEIENLNLDDHLNIKQLIIQTVNTIINDNITTVQLVSTKYYIEKELLDRIEKEYGILFFEQDKISNNKNIVNTNSNDNILQIIENVIVYCIDNKTKNDHDIIKYIVQLLKHNRKNYDLAFLCSKVNDFLGSNITFDLLEYISNLALNDLENMIIDSYGDFNLTPSNEIIQMCKIILDNVFETNMSTINLINFDNVDINSIRGAIEIMIINKISDKYNKNIDLESLNKIYYNN